MTSIGDRMKTYEGVFQYQLPINMPVIIRIDGRAFHTLTRSMNKPFDHGFVDLMQQVALDVFKECSGAKISFVQSDEISVVLTNDDTYETQPWFGNKLQKLVSISASSATASFMMRSKGRVDNKLVTFDARAFVVPEHEVNNYLIWRQQDWERNSLSMLARKHFSQKQLTGKKRPEIHDMLHGVGVNWDNLPTHLKRGSVVIRDVVYNGLDEEWVNRGPYLDLNPPIFTTSFGCDYLGAALQRVV